jgi:uncharacterized phiE125 gp8 family phage protein
MRPMLITAPAVEPVSLAEAKSWLREDNDDEDQLIQTLLVSARLTLEAWTRRFFITQGWRLVCDNWPFQKSGTQSITITFAPCRAVTAIRVYNINDTASLIDPTAYRVRIGDQGGCILFETPPKPPGRALEGVEIDFTVGYGSAPSQIPEPLRQAILLLVAHWREHRGDDTALMAFPSTAMALCAPYRRERLT